MDFSEEVNRETGVSNAKVTIYPKKGYGDVGMLRWFMEHNKPDMLFLLTDPRSFRFVFESRHEYLDVPILYWDLWDDTPLAYYNIPFYKSCDMLCSINKQTHNFHKLLLGDGHWKLSNAHQKIYGKTA